jgi:pyoverdine/dityrosine biosynthesis protein Dit1/alpha-ketoglutarate-dependent taurine dioxygenase
MIDTVPSKTIENGIVTMTSAEVGSETNSESLSDDEPYSASAAGEKALQVLQIIEAYSVNFEQSDSWDGLVGLVPTVTKQVENCEPVRLLLPGFPFKSPNNQVLGSLPDLGEKLALGHLNGLCQNIAAVYEYGAEIDICSNGLVYNDLLGVPDETVWDYAEAVQFIAQNDLRHIKFIHLWDLLEHPGTFEHPGTWTKDFCISHASCIRRELVYRYGDVEFEADLTDKSNNNMIYGDVIKFVSAELASSSFLKNLSTDRKDLEILGIARSMIGRWKAYTSALEAYTSALEADGKNHIWLSASPYDPARKGKLSMSLFPQERGSLGLTPWQSAIAIELDGTFRAIRASDSELQQTHELVYMNGRPSHYRAKSDIFDWKADGLDVTFEHLYPTGTIIRPANMSTPAQAAPSLRMLPMKKVRILSQTFSPIVLRGFSETNQEDIFVEKGHELGEVLTWKSAFGLILKIKDSGEVDRSANNVTSNEAMPMHFDGIFKFVDHTDPVTGEVKKVLTPPRYQYFTCISTAPKGTGYTLFANSRLFLRHLPFPWTLSRLENVTWDMVNDGFWSAKQTGLPLIVPHKETGAPCLRWHQPWVDTKFSKYYVTIENEDQSLVDVINKLLYDYRVCLRFEWEAGDLVINDNMSMLHTRTAFTGSSEREMWRIHFD